MTRGAVDCPKFHRHSSPGTAHYVCMEDCFMWRALCLEKKNVSFLEGSKDSIRGGRWDKERSWHVTFVRFGLRWGVCRSADVRSVPDTDVAKSKDPVGTFELLGWRRHLEHEREEVRLTDRTKSGRVAWRGDVVEGDDIYRSDSPETPVLVYDKGTHRSHDWYHWTYVVRDLLPSFLLLPSTHFSLYYYGFNSRRYVWHLPWDYDSPYN